MTSIQSQSALFAITASTTTKSTASTDDALFELLSQTQQESKASSKSSSSGTTSGALGINSAAFGALFGGGDILDSLFGEFSSSSGSSSGIGDIMSVLNPEASSGSDNDFITGGGPLPAFLTMVKSQYGLNAEQAQALDNIALAFKDAQNTPETVNQISAALREAGIA
jgi:hypothetical protein